jgi:hypothetical protein
MLSDLSVGDIINAIASVTDPLDDSVDESGLSVMIDGRRVRISFTPESVVPEGVARKLVRQNRYSVDALDMFARAVADWQIGGAR